MIDRELKVVMLNVAARDYCGTQWDEIIGKPFDGTTKFLGPFGEFDIHFVFTKGQDFTLERKSPRDPSRFERSSSIP